MATIGGAKPWRTNFPADAYATCSACHLPDGAGVPGAFPPVRNRVAKIAALEGGRAYLVAVVTYGLMGTISVDGMQYFGVMAGNSGTHDAQDVAAALNYVIFELSDDDTSGIEPFTADEVTTIQAGTEVKTPNGAGQESAAAGRGTRRPMALIRKLAWAGFV